MPRLVELRTYKLKAGARRRFHELVASASVPLLRQFDIDVVSYGYSAGSRNGYYLVRSYEDMESLQREEARFYGSDTWRHGPREEILSLIESHYSVTFELDDAAVDELRSAVFPPLGPSL